MSKTGRQGASGGAGGDGREGGEGPGGEGPGGDGQGGEGPGGDGEQAGEARTALDVLARLDLFAGLALAHIKRIVAIGLEEPHARGAKIFEEGETGDKFYVILDGAVRISRFVAGLGEEALAVLRPGTYFGEMSLIDDESRSAAAIAHETCRLFVIKRADFADLLFVDRDLAHELLWKMVRTLSRRLRATNDKMTFLAASSKF